MLSVRYWPQRFSSWRQASRGARAPFGGLSVSPGVSGGIWVNCYEDTVLTTTRMYQLRTGTSRKVLQCLHPEYQTVAARISSFVGWPRHMTQTPTQLAEAGLFYTGVEDQVRCFMCGGGLRRWDADDVPWTEHCRWFPECPYAREQKGDDFIALVQASAANSNEDRESGNDSVTGLMEGMALKYPEFRAALDEHISTCVEMGYQVQDVNEAIQELKNMGNIKPTIEELIDLVEVIKKRRQKDSDLKRSQDETPLQENVRQMITCMLCGKNKINVLFLPCTHHRLCMDCAETLSKCPVCDRNIRQKTKNLSCVGNEGNVNAQYRYVTANCRSKQFRRTILMK